MATDSLSPIVRPVTRLLVANRGEIARRVIRTCRRLGISTVAVYSHADRYAPYVREADLAMPLPGNTAAETYLRADLLVQAALATGCTAVHPGYGFLSENAAFARTVHDAGLVFVGPPADAIEAMGSKIGAKQMMRAASVPVLPDNTVESLAEIGLPALVKASAGGGGRGMRLVRSADELDDAIAAAQREAASAFGDGTVFVERYVEGGRHVEIQVFADHHGNTVALFERDCTVQRRHQKIVEEAPSPAVGPQLRERMSAAAVAAAEAVGYVGAGTVEFLLDSDGGFFFLEMNTRLQVEHPVTEMITGLDLVELQLAVAGGEPLPPSALAPAITGHAVEVRLCAEDPYHGYRSSSGTFTRIEFPAIDGVRIDTGVDTGSTISPYYDSMIAKVIAHAPTRAGAIQKLQRALSTAHLIGPVTNRTQLLDLLPRVDTEWQQLHTGWLDAQGALEAPPIEPAFVAAAGLAVVRADAATRRVLPHVPVGWRSNPSDPQSVQVGDHTVHYRLDRSGAISHLTVDDEPVAEQWLPAIDFIETQIVDDTVFVSRGLYRFTIPPRFPLPDEAGRAGSLVAPMPGSVLRLLVAVGDSVAAGQPLLAMEAMKMEHQVVAPSAGTVAEIFVQVGQQLAHGQRLVQLDTAGGDE
ncbi:MAG: biotin carboxylase N-terminal domain-containing protein [Actinomycetota bacterium]